MNRAIGRVALACLAMFLLLLLNINYVQAFQSSSLAAEPGNSRVFSQQFQYQRGAIYVGGGTKIAGSRLIRGTSNYQRFYRYGRVYAGVTGYDSIYGKTGIERAENSQLAGTAPGLAVPNLIGLLTGKARQGASVYLTISPQAQQAAYKGLAALGRPGAVVALDPATGAILAMASYPAYDPNAYTTLDGGQLDKIDKRIRTDPAQPLLNRAINATYPPGSTFKIVTSSAAFSTGAVRDAATAVPAPTSFQLPGSTSVLVNDSNEVCANGNPPILTAFLLSCNTAFAKLGVKVGGPALTDFATRYGMNKPNLAIPLPVSPSVIPVQRDAAHAALTAIGQFDDAVTPLQEAMLAAAVANNGTLMTPHLVQEVQAPDLSRTQVTPTVLSRPVTPQVAGYLQQMMTAVVQSPSGTAFAENKAVTGIEIAGKTGTAQNGINNTSLNDAVFTAFAPVGNPKIAVGVIIQGGGYGAAAAAPVAVQVIQAYLGHK